jgi:glycerate kinase
MAAVGRARRSLTTAGRDRALVLCCPDKFRGSLSAADAASALARGVARTGRRARPLPLADGGEGTLVALCPDAAVRRRAVVTGPLGSPVEAAWGIRDEAAVVESAQASGLALVACNDPLRATTRGTGELIHAALESGAGRVIVGLGGSATVDGGLGALEALDFDLRGAEVVVACDVETRFVDAARVFAPQKGATEAEVALLDERLRSLADRYENELGVDVRTMAGGGAAGGLAGGLAALGASLRPGAPLVADILGLDEALAEASLAITGEGRYDTTSRAGKVVGHVLREAEAAGVRAAIVAGDAEPDALAALPSTVSYVTLVALAGSIDDALRDAERLVADAGERLAG